MIYLIVLSVALLPVVLLAVASATARRPDNLGVRDGRLGPCPDLPNCVSSRADDAGHRIEPIAFTGDPSDAQKRLIHVLRSMPRVAVVKEEADYLYAEATTRIFRFVDDVEFVIDSQESVIHVRSASRVGRSDLGANRARVERVRAAFDRSTP